MLFPYRRNSGMSIKRNLGLVGAGHWGKNLARNFEALGALHTICDAQRHLLDSYQNLYPAASLTTSYDDILNNAAIELVAIAAPASLHYSLAKAALLAGKDVYVEKPLCLEVSEAEALIQLADQKEKILMVGHLLQYHPVVGHLQDMIAQGIFGQLYYIASHRLNLGQIRTEENVLWSFAPHDISVILSLLGNSLPTTVRCSGQSYLSRDIPDTAIANLTFANNVQAHIYTSWIHPFKEQKLVIVGSQAMAIFDDTLEWPNKLTLYNSPVEWHNGLLPRANKTVGQRIEVVQKEPLREECAHFLQCCALRQTPKTDGKEGLRVLKVLQAAEASLHEGGAPCAPHRPHKDFFAHPTAHIDARAVIGAGTKIWHFSHVMHNASLGNCCNIGQNVVISPHVSLGNNVKIQNNVSVYSGVICEDDTFLGPSMVFTNVINPRSAVNRRGEYQKTAVRKGASIGANATIVCGVELGAYSFIGAGAVVTKNVKPFALMVGNPAKQIGWMSRHGERLDLPVSGSPEEEIQASCPATGEVYILQGDSLRLEASEASVAGKP